MNKIKYWLIAINLLAVLSYFAIETADKERILKHAPEVRLKLAPVDPRSLMQGDYMRLNFDIINRSFDFKQERGNHIKYAIVSVPDGEYIRTQADNQGIAPDEVAIKVITEAYWSHLSSENYFFEEGTGHLYNDAKFALVSVDEDGNIYIKNLCDSIGNIIEPKAQSKDNK